jgi:RNA polymerase sigma-70 factor (ECF subfamily)
VTDGARTAALWERFAGELRRGFRRRGADAELAEDLLQETFLRLHARGDALAEAERVGAWVQRVADNVLIDHRRRRAPLARELADPSDEAPEEDVPATVAGWLPAFVRELPAEAREALELHELEGLTHAEIAARTGLSVSGVKSRVQRGRERLRAALLQCCAFELDRRGAPTHWRPRRRSACSDC